MSMQRKQMRALLEKRLSKGKIGTLRAHGWLNHILDSMEDASRTAEEKGRKNYETIMMKGIKEWDGSTNSKLGTELNKIRNG